MKITFLGSGSFFASPGNFHSNLLLQTDSGKNLLIDCGSDLRHSLVACRLKPQNIHAVYVSHPHDDHAGGLEYLGFAGYFMPDMKKPDLFCHESLLDQLWFGRLAVAMATLSEKQACFSDYYKLHRVRKGFDFAGIHFRLVPAIHVVNNKSGHMYSYGLFMTLNNVRVYFTSDVGFPNVKFDPKTWDLEAHYRNYLRADLIFHDCETINASEVHAHYNFLKEMDPKIKSKMWLYHTQASVQPVVTDDGFLGIVQQGQEFNF